MMVIRERKDTNLLFKRHRKSLETYLTNMCCGNGNVLIDEIKPYPQYYKIYWIQTPISKDLSHLTIICFVLHH